MFKNTEKQILAFLRGCCFCR